MEGNNYLINGLLASMAAAFVIIAILMGILFRSFIMTIISLIPNVIPLLITAGIMGFFNIPLKPSTVLIFSIAFGIAVDDTIHFLAKYKQELLRHDWNISKTVTTTIKETALSMTYTSIILFFGFIVFAASDFNGTVNLGILTSITLIVAMFANLLLLPCLLLSLEKYINRRTLAKSNLTTID
jgi:predicted RND superfamily exporter protein